MRFSSLVVLIVLVAAGSAMAPGQTAAAGSNSDPKAPAETNAEFFAAADQVLGTMSRILDLPVKAPLKKSIRTKAQIRQYLVAEQKKSQSAKQSYADQRTLEAFGLIPKGFPLDSFLLDLLTDQVAGLYDPHEKEFYIADWISPAEQMPVMAHELTHALDDEYFHLEKWQKAAKSNDDAEMARDAVVEGSALAAMMDYTLSDLHTDVRQLPDIAPFIQSSFVGDMDKDPSLAKAPPFIRDELLFPYLEGAVFTQQFLKANSGWADFEKVFRNPPVSTQQILHPKLYFQGVKPRQVKLPHLSSALPHGWKKLDENIVGEFALQELLKQYLGPETAERYSPMWTGDRYAVFENKSTKQLILVVRYALDSEKDAGSFFDVYRDALERKYAVKKSDAEGPEFAAFGNAFLRCYRDECLSVEGANRSLFDRVNRNLGWPPEPAQAPTVDTRARASSSSPVSLQ